MPPFLNSYTSFDETLTRSDFLKTSKDLEGFKLDDVFKSCGDVKGWIANG